jgi:hypothetical protein
MKGKFKQVCQYQQQLHLTLTISTKRTTTSHPNTINKAGVIISVLASSAGDREFELCSGQIKDYKIGMCCFSVKHNKRRSKHFHWCPHLQFYRFLLSLNMNQVLEKLHLGQLPYIANFASQCNLYLL